MHSSRAFKAGSLQLKPALVLICGLFWGIWCAVGQSFAAEPEMSAALLRTKYTELSRPLSNNQFERPLYLNSEESSHDLKGEIYAVVDYPFATVKQALNDPTHWCDVLILHVNIKYCHAASAKTGTIFSVNLGKKDEQPLTDAYRVEFNYRGLVATPDYFAVALDAEDGPVSTHGYRVRIEATSLKDEHTFLHFTYAYSFGVAGRLAMEGYLATLGRNKVGFTVIGKQPDGQPTYIKGVRGVVERNTMRYYLAIDAYLAALASPPDEQLDKRLQFWYNSTNLYARQLHEVERADYLEMKHKEYQRQQVAQ